MAKVKKPVWPGVTIGTLVDLQAKCADFFLSALKGIGADEGFELEAGEGSEAGGSSKPSVRDQDEFQGFQGSNENMFVFNCANGSLLLAALNERSRKLLFVNEEHGVH